MASFNDAMWIEPLQIYRVVGEIRAIEGEGGKWKVVCIFDTGDEDKKVIPIKAFDTRELAVAFLDGINWYRSNNDSILPITGE